MNAKEMLHGIVWTLIQVPWKIGDHMVVIFRINKKLWDSYVYVVTNEPLIKGWHIIFECSKVMNGDKNICIVYLKSNLIISSCFLIVNAFTTEIHEEDQYTVVKPKQLSKTVRKSWTNTRKISIL